MTKIKSKQHSILVVEDDGITRTMVSAMLMDAGYHVRTVSDGRECLDCLENFTPDVILMDIQMPGLDGLEVCRKLKDDVRLETIPVVFATGSTDDETLQAAFDAGGRDYIRKPLNRLELLARLGQVLDLQETQQKRMETEKLKGVLETAGGVCHKLNQPLQYVMGAIQILMMDLPQEDKMFKQLDAVREKIEQMGDITRKLAEITRYRTTPHAGGQNILDIDDSSP